MVAARESDLYQPVKDYLQDLGFCIRGEVRKCDAVGVMGDTIIAVELKLNFGVSVLYQALQRLASVDFVYVAVAVPDGRKARANWDEQVPDAIRLCRMLGVGLLSVRDGLVVHMSDPAPYQPRKVPKARAKMLGEFTRRSGDHNLGGTTRRPRVTAYREEALMCARALAIGGIMTPAGVKAATGLANASKFLLSNPYGWFRKEEVRGQYSLAPLGEDALLTYSDVVAAQTRLEIRLNGLPPA
jgi:hypothetical protein